MTFNQKVVVLHVVRVMVGVDMMVVVRIMKVTIHRIVVVEPAELPMPSYIPDVIYVIAAVRHCIATGKVIHEVRAFLTGTIDGRNIVLVHETTAADVRAAIRHPVTTQIFIHHRTFAQSSASYCREVVPVHGLRRARDDAAVHDILATDVIVNIGDAFSLSARNQGCVQFQRQPFATLMATAVGGGIAARWGVHVSALQPTTIKEAGVRFYQVAIRANMTAAFGHYTAAVVSAVLVHTVGQR
jgi:hypothetical protein